MYRFSKKEKRGALEECSPIQHPPSWAFLFLGFLALELADAFAPLDFLALELVEVFPHWRFLPDGTSSEEILDGSAHLLLGSVVFHK